MGRIGMVLVTGTALGSSVVMTRLGVHEIPPLPLVALRLSVATVAFLAVLVLLKRRFPRDRRTLLDIGLVGVTQGLPLLAFTIALQFISSGVLTMFLALIPLFTGLMAHVWLNQERLGFAKAGGLAVAFGGVLLLVATRTTGLTAGASGADVRGYGLALAGALVIAASVVYTRRRLRHVDVVVLTAGQFLAACLVVVPIALLVGSVNLAAVSWTGWMAVAYTGMVGSFSAFFLMFTLNRRYGATTSVLPTYLTPAVSAVLGAVLLGEVITPPFLAAAGMILAGVLLAIRQATPRLMQAEAG